MSKEYSKDSGYTFPDKRISNVTGDGKAQINILCTCGEQIERVIDLGETTVIMCPKCGKPVFRGERFH